MPRQDAFTAFYRPEVEQLPHFDGATYDASRDQLRLTGQLQRVTDLMRDGVWRTLGEIEAVTGDQTQSISSRLRDLRKLKFGRWTVERRRRSAGLYEYHVAAKVG